MQDGEITIGTRDGAAHVLRCLKVWYDLPNDVLFNATNLVDRFLTKMKVKPKHMACISVGSFHLAVKQLGLLPIDTEDLVAISQVSWNFLHTICLFDFPTCDVRYSACSGVKIFGIIFFLNVSQNQPCVGNVCKHVRVVCDVTTYENFKFSIFFVFYRTTRVLCDTGKLKVWQLDIWKFLTHNRTKKSIQRKNVFTLPPFPDLSVAHLRWEQPNNFALKHADTSK